MPQLRSLGDYFDWACQQIERRDAELLSEHALNVSSTLLYTQPEREIFNTPGTRFQELVRQRATGQPLAYLTGEAHFWNLRLEITPRVLVPRPETERVVASALQVLFPGARVLDLGTGSGAIALALRSEMELSVLATDVDSNALDVCRQNAQKLELEVETLVSDWYSNVQGRFDLIVANPPYVQEHDPRLLENGIRFEPRVALASGIDGLHDLRNVIQGAKSHLNPNGYLIVEHGYDQRNSIVELFRIAQLQCIRVEDDYARLPRVVIGKNCE